jgi:hypothetical protein
MGLEGLLQGYIYFTLLRVCMHDCMDMLIVSTCYIERILYVFCIREFIHLKSVTGDSELSSSKNSASLDGPQNTNGDFVVDGSNDIV